MKNKRGTALLFPLAIPVVFGFHVAFTCLTAAAVWHIPAWEKAKKNGTEVAYQAQQMWPQQWFAKLPGGADHK